jgi:hypothetical protein
MEVNAVTDTTTIIAATYTDSYISRHIAAAVAAFPDLTPEGLRGGPFDPSPQYRWHPQQIATAMTFLRQCRKNKKSNFYSSDIKHWAEAWGGGYVINGAAIVAAIALGFKVTRSRGGLYARIGLHKNDLAKLIRPPANCWWRS